MSSSKLTRSDLMSLEKYSEIRPQFRANVIAHKKNRIVIPGPNMSLHFEDRLTMHYQVQEMLRAERTFEAAGIQDELDAYNPLVPDGSNWKCTFMIEYDDPEVRKKQLARLRGIENKVWVQVKGFDRVYAIADEDMERENEEKTASVHFLRFEFSPEMIQALKGGTSVGAGIAHENCSTEVASLPENVRAALVQDLA
jgi:hypothetical protein